MSDYPLDKLKQWREITDAAGLTLEPWQWRVLARLCSECEPTIRDEWVEKAARAAFDDAFMRHAPEYVARWDDEHEGVRESWRVIARAALTAVADDIRAEALREAAGDPELSPLLHAEDDDQFIGGAAHGMGPVEAHGVVEDWLHDRADRIGGRHE